MSVGGSLEDRILGSCEQTHYERDDDVDRPTQTPPKRWLKDSHFLPDSGLGMRKRRRNRKKLI